MSKGPDRNNKHPDTIYYYSTLIYKMSNPSKFSALRMMKPFVYKGNVVYIS